MKKQRTKLKMLNIDTVKNMTGLSHGSMLEMGKWGRFPKPSLMWSAADIKDWLEKRTLKKQSKDRRLFENK